MIISVKHLYIGCTLMIISLLNQKGGATKTTLARALAVEFVNNDWAVHVADMDVYQKTLFNWADRREQANILPAIEVALYREPKTALKAAKTTDLLIVDGKAFADSHVYDFAKPSDLIVIPVGVSTDDLQPSLELAVELVNKGIDRNKILFVVSKVPKNGDKEAMATRSSIEGWNFNVVRGWIYLQTAYSQAMDEGKALHETKFKELNANVDRIIQQIVNKALELNGS